MLKKVIWPAPIAILAVCSPAHAALPEPVKAMIDAAIKSGNATDIQAISKLAKATNPDDSAEVDAMLAEYNAKQAQLAAAAEREKLAGGFFDNWSGQGQIGGFRSTGNSSNSGISGGIKLKKESVKWRLNVRALADYQRSNGVTSRERIGGSIEPEYKINDRLYFYGLTQFERDRFQGFSARYTISGGLGYAVVKEKGITLNVKAGPAWRFTEFVDGGSDSSIAGLIGLDFGWQIADNVKLAQIAGATVTSEAENFTTAVAIFSSETNTFNATTTLTAKLVSALSMRFSYSFEHETNPPVGRAKTDTVSRASLVYDF